MFLQHLTPILIRRPQLRYVVCLEVIPLKPKLSCLPWLNHESCFMVWKEELEVVMVIHGKLPQQSTA